MNAKKRRESAPLRPVSGGGVVRFMEDRRALRAVTVGLAAAALAVGLLLTGMLGRAERLSYDWRVRTLAPGGQSGDVVVVVFDEGTVRNFPQFGQWGAWPRSVFAELVRALSRAGAKTIALDLLFIDGNAAEADAELVAACREAGNVVAACALRGGGEDSGGAEAALAVGDRLALGGGSGSFPAYPAASMPYAELIPVLAAVGGVQLEPDTDGVVRGLSPAAHWQGRLWPAFSTAAARQYLGGEFVKSKDGFRLGGYRFPLDERGRKLVYWMGRNVGAPVRRFRTVPAGWVLENRGEATGAEMSGLFRGKVVVVGATAAGAFEPRVTSLGMEPGVYIHAAAVENLLGGYYVTRPGIELTAFLTALMSLLVALSFLGRGWWAALRGSLAWAGISGSYLGVACLSYGQSRVWLDLVAPQAGALMALAGSLAAGYLVEGRQALRFRRALSRFLSPQVLSAVAGDLDSLRPGMGRRREVSMMFCDVRGFTTLSESMEPEAVMEVLDLYLGRMTEVIMANGGTLSKYLGDGIMAFWGAPLETPDHAAQAARAAIEMISAQEEVKLQLVAAGRPAFDIGIGVHTGPAIVGTVGSEDRIEYTALGDTVNVASRVESLTKDFKVRIVVTAETARRAGTGFCFRPLGSVQVKGRSGGVEVMELAGFNKAKTEGAAS